jgi:iron(III) transport system permease protein
MRAKHVVLATAFGVLILCGVLPLAAMLLTSITVDGRLSAGAYSGLLTSERHRMLFGNSFRLAAATAFGAAAIGVPLGVTLARTNLPFRRVLAILFTIPLVVPPYVSAVAWFHMLGRNGILAQSISPALGEWTSSWFFGLPGCLLVLVPGLMPVVLLLTMSLVRGINPELEEAGRLVSTWTDVLRRITLPLCMRGIVFAVGLVFLLALGEFGVPSYLRYEVFPVESFTQFAAFLDFRAATASATPLLLFSVLVLTIEYVYLRGDPVPMRATARQPLLISLGHVRKVMFTLVALLGGVLIVMPVAALARQAAWGAALAQALPPASGTITRSFGYAAVGASVLAVMGLLLGYAIDRRALPFWRAIDWTAIALFAMPSTVVGIGLVALWNRPLPVPVYGTPAIIILGYIAQYTALTSRLTASAVNQIPVSLEDAARVAGASWTRRMHFIVVPLCGRGLVVSWLAAYVFCLRDLGISALVYPPDGDTLPVRTFTLMANGPPDVVAALCLFMVLMTVIPLAVAAAVLNGPRAHLKEIHDAES